MNKTHIDQRVEALEKTLKERQKELTNLCFEHAACKAQSAGDEGDACFWIEQKSFLTGEIQSLSNQLEVLRNLDSEAMLEDLADGVARLGSLVKIQMRYEDGSVEDLEVKIITFGSMSLDDGTYSEITDKSPIGKAIIGKKVGDVCQCKLPNENASISILAIN